MNWIEDSIRSQLDMAERLLRLARIYCEAGAHQRAVELLRDAQAECDSAERNVQTLLQKMKDG